MNSKYALALIALVGVGVFALPATMSLFSGQHSFYNIDATGNQVPCVKCHGDVIAELSANADQTGNGSQLRSPGPHASMSCEYCHRIEAGASSGDDAIYQIYYTNGTSKRTMLISLTDFEAHNFPPTINNTDNVTQIQNYWNATSGNLFVAFTVSNSTTNTTVVLTAGEPSIVPLYNADGSAKDTDPNTKNSGFQLRGTSTRTGPRVGPSNFIYNGTTQPALNFNGIGSRTVNPGGSYHAASLVSCMECHGGEPPLGHETSRTVGPSGTLLCSDCHYGGGPAAEGKAGGQMRNLWAGGFGLTERRFDTGEAEAHTVWVTTKGVSRFDNPAGPIKVNNDACIACHTHVAVDITFKKGYKIKLEASIDKLNGTVTMGPTSIEGDVIQDTYGNASGQTWAVGNKVYYWNSSAVMYINGNTSQQINFPLTGSSGDSKEALLAP